MNAVASSVVFQQRSRTALRCMHACGAGRVFTVLRVEEVRHFKGLLRKVDNTFVKDHALSKSLVEAARPEAQHALSVLQAYLASED